MFQLKRQQDELTCRQLNRSIVVEQAEPMIVEQPVTEENPALNESRTNEIYELQDKLTESIEEKVGLIVSVLNSIIFLF